jgi:DNA sulfur modification protein DndC
MEDLLPQIFEQATGNRFPAGPLDDNLALGSEDMQILREICGTNELAYQLTRELLDVERRYRTVSRRAGLMNALEDALCRSFYVDEEDATSRALRERNARLSANQGLYQQLSLSDAELSSGPTPTAATRGGSESA